MKNSKRWSVGIGGELVIPIEDMRTGDGLPAAPTAFRFQVTPHLANDVAEPASGAQLVADLYNAAADFIDDLAPDDDMRLTLADDVEPVRKVVHVPNVPGPAGVCWAGNPKGMGYCQLPTGHDAGENPTAHQWERPTLATPDGQRAALALRSLGDAARAGGDGQA